MTCVPITTRPAEAPQERLTELLKDFPRPDEIDYLRRQLAEAKGLTEYGKAKIERRLALVRERIPLIKPLIRPGVSVFAYPGLGAAGIITFTPGPPCGYLLAIGAETRPEDISQPPVICVSLDQNGIITQVTHLALPN